MVTKAQIERLRNFDLSEQIIAVDFDGTCVVHEFPSIGQTVPYAVEVLQALSDAKAKIILWTMRSDQLDAFNSPSNSNGKEYLAEASAWFASNGISLHSINNNPQQHRWTSSPKCYAHVYIDDAALGCPLIVTAKSRPYVDWEAVLRLLIAKFDYELV